LEFAVFQFGPCLGFGACYLELIRALGFGACDLEFTVGFALAARALFVV
jgi:hypothetical protein